MSFFFVAAEACGVPEALRASPGRCERSADTEATAEEGGMLLAHGRAVEVEDERLAREWREHQDLVLVPGVEVYTRLPNKLQAALQWVARHVPVDWVLKVDDDCWVRLPRLMPYLRSADANARDGPVVLGLIARDYHVIRAGRWAESATYLLDTYPAFPLGSAGYVVSREIVHYVADSELQMYQGEDVSMGIWLHEKYREHIVWISSALFARHGNCSDTWPAVLSVIGHDLTAADLLRCHHTPPNLLFYPKAAAERKNWSRT